MLVIKYSSYKKQMCRIVIFIVIFATVGGIEPHSLQNYLYNSFLVF